MIDEELKKLEISMKLKEFLGEEGIRLFRHLKRLTGSCSPVLKLNFAKKGVPVHPVHFREGMQIRNFLRTLPECEGMNLDDEWSELVELAIRN